MKSISANLNIIIKAAEKTSKALIRDFGEIEKLQVSVKGPSDFVSNADTKAEKIIIEELKKARPNYSIISEEEGSETNKNTENVWIIDPIDGTTNFLHGIPHFAVSIALRAKNEIVCGVIYDPIKDEMFYAEKNNGAYFNNYRIKVSKRKNFDDCIFATGGSDEEKLKNKDIANLTIRKTGSAALDMAYVAAGRFDGYFQRNLNLWDIAAGIIIVTEAGGQTNEIDLSKNKNINIIASSSSISEKLGKNLINF
jgi:myo-inositol-1(or 4)-monophosphatase